MVTLNYVLVRIRVEEGGLEKLVINYVRTKWIAHSSLEKSPNLVNFI